MRISKHSSTITAVEKRKNKCTPSSLFEKEMSELRERKVQPQREYRERLREEDKGTLMSSSDAELKFIKTEELYDPCEIFREEGKITTMSSSDAEIKFIKTEEPHASCERLREEDRGTVISSSDAEIKFIITELYAPCEILREEAKETLMSSGDAETKFIKAEEPYNPCRNDGYLYIYKEEEQLQQNDFLNLNPELQPKRKRKPKSPISVDELLKKREAKSQKQREYRERLRMEGKFQEMLAKDNERKRLKRAEVRKQKKSPNFTLDKVPESQLEKATSGQQRKNKRSPRDSLSEDELLKKRNKKAEQQRKYREKLRKQKELLGITVKRPRRNHVRICLSNDELLKLQKITAAEQREYCEGVPERQRLKRESLREQKELQIEKASIRKESERLHEEGKGATMDCSVVESENIKREEPFAPCENDGNIYICKRQEQLHENDFSNLELEKIPESLSEKNSTRKQRGRKRTPRASLSVDQLLKIRIRKAEKQREYREKLRKEEEARGINVKRRRRNRTLRCLSNDELFKIHKKTAEKQRRYRERLCKEGKFLEIRARYTERQRLKRQSLRKQKELLSQKATITTESERFHEDGKGTTVDSSDGNLYICKTEEQLQEYDFSNLKLEKNPEYCEILCEESKGTTMVSSGIESEHILLEEHDAPCKILRREGK